MFWLTVVAVALIWIAAWLVWMNGNSRRPEVEKAKLAPLGAGFAASSESKLTRAAQQGRIGTYDFDGTVYCAECNSSRGHARGCRQK